MAYINYKLLYDKGLSDDDYHLLQKIFQKEEFLLEGFLDRFKHFLDLGLIQYLKDKENTIKGIRISKKGKKFLSDLETKGYTDTIGIILDKLIGMYEVEDKIIGKKLEVKSRLIWFTEQTGFSPTIIIKSVQEYLDNNPEYTMSLENLLWKPQSVAFSVHKNLKQSKLFDVINTKYKLDETFFLKTMNKHNEWLFSVAKLSPPRKGDDHIYFTGSYKGDLEHINKINEELSYEVGDINNLFRE